MLLIQLKPKYILNNLRLGLDTIMTANYSASREDAQNNNLKRLLLSLNQELLFLQEAHIDLKIITFLTRYKIVSGTDLCSGC